MTDDIKKVGAVVMNCNPFTTGHRYLIEYAADKTDRLYVFCVEENKSFFRFEDRLEMIKCGIRDLDNVVVVPSGRYIISAVTFPEYFLKESCKDEEIDVTEDLRIFCEKIAPKLHISKRFAGEEPIDPVTRQYNIKMAQMLPEYGIQFEEISRQKDSSSGIISATKVRSYLKMQKYDKLKTLVPETTYEILKEKYFDK